MRLLEAGIDVYTTLNVQHLESLNDVIAQITGVVVRETVPDSIFQQADEVELVDIAAGRPLGAVAGGQGLHRPRGRAGDGQLLHQGQPDRAAGVGPAADGRAGGRADGRVPRRARGAGHVARPRAAAGLRRSESVCGPAGSGHLPHGGQPEVALGGGPRRDARRRRPFRRRPRATHANAAAGRATRRRDGHLSGQSIADELIHYARGRNVTKIVVGKPKQPRWKELFRGSLVYELTRKCGDIDVYVISGDPQPALPPAAAPRLLPGSRLDYFWALVVVMVCTASQRRAVAVSDDADQSGDDLPAGRGGRRALAGARAVDPGVRSGRGRVRLLLRAAALDVRGGRYAILSDVRW